MPPVSHPKQPLTYLRLLNLEVDLLINSGVPTLKEGQQRVVNNLSPSAPPRELVFMLEYLLLQERLSRLCRRGRRSEVRCQKP
jgi:hypothetical protein